MILDFMEDGGLGAGFIYKSTTEAFYYNGTTFTQISDADYPAETVKGLVYLDGTYYVMTPQAVIYGSDINNGASWSALNAIQSQSEPDGGVCLARQLNLVVAFNTYSTEFFYDAANPTGSPLAPYTSSFLEVGCATSGSVVLADNQLIFMSQGRQKGRQIQILKGTVPSPISTPFIDKILSKVSLVGTTSNYIKLGGHAFYILTLPAANLTLVYDFVTGHWGNWTQMTLSPTSKNVSAATWVNGVATLTVTSHGYTDGMYAIIAGMPTEWNTSSLINVEDTNTISYSLPSAPSTYTSGGTVTPYVEAYFALGDYSKSGELDLIQDSTTGAVFSVDSGIYLDGTNPIKLGIRTTNFDGGTSDMKFFSRLEIIGDKLIGTAYVRYSNDDFQTWCKYRPVDLSVPRSQILRLGRGRRRAFEMINYDNKPIRFHNMDLTVDKGFV